MSSNPFLGIKQAIDNLFMTDWCGRIGFPDYALKNNFANIRRLEKRLARIEQAHNDQTTEEAFRQRRPVSRL